MAASATLRSAAATAPCRSVASTCPFRAWCTPWLRRYAPVPCASTYVVPLPHRDCVTLLRLTRASPRRPVPHTRCKAQDCVESCAQLTLTQHRLLASTLPSAAPPLRALTTKAPPQQQNPSLDPSHPSPRRAVQEAVLASCADHNMPGCETCTAEFDECPDTLAALSRVCLAHRMEACAQFYTMCDSAGADLAHFCDSRTASYDPPMRMYFHNGASWAPLLRLGLLLLAAQPQCVDLRTRTLARSRMRRERRPLAWIAVWRRCLGSLHSPSMRTVVHLRSAHGHQLCSMSSQLVPQITAVPFGREHMLVRVQASATSSSSGASCPTLAASMRA